MESKDKLPFGPREVAFEIVEAWLGAVRDRLDDYGIAEEAAATLNQFYGLDLTPDCLRAFISQEVDIDDVARIIEPMRSWPAMMGYPTRQSDGSLELPHLSMPNADN